MFERLVERVEHIGKVKPIREDEECLILIQSLNKLRDLICLNKEDQEMNSHKSLLLSKVSKMLAAELINYSQSKASQSEVIYLLFLYLSSLDTYKLNTQEVPNAKILVFSIQLQDHEDIKIRKEAARQLDLFQNLHSVEVLPDLVIEVKHFFDRNQVNIFDKLGHLE